MPTSPDFARATSFIWHSARLLDRARFAYFFLDGDKEAVVAALRAYQNKDGGFGNALEPDLRTTNSQPAHVRLALETLDHVDGFDNAMVKEACDYLLTISNADGGIPFVLPSARAYPHAPWWQTGDHPPSAPTFTAPIAGLLYKHHVSHPWLERAAEYCWHEAESYGMAALKGSSEDIDRIGLSYNALALLIFLEHVPDRSRAKKAFELIGRFILDHKVVEVDAPAGGEAHTPLEYASSPQRMARSLFSDEVMAAHLDKLAAAQLPDGGWMINFLDWNPATTLEWRGFATVENLLLLRAYGRLA